MEDQVKLIQGETLLGDKFQFIIFINQYIGNKGGSGAIVNKAIQRSRPYEQLAVKITPFNQKNKQKVFKEIQIIRSLPDHPNIIKVLPIKINSTNYSYIFMEYCNQGTLQNLIQNRKGNFTQNQIFNIFYQVVSGYKILWQRKILHQDLKPNNIFIKNKKFKIADFDLSIFHEGVTFGTMRQGTFTYMPPQKLSGKQYHANAKSDIYSMGVIFFKLIFKYHPYVNGSVQSLQNYVQRLYQNPARISKLVLSNISIEMNQFLDLILKMILKQQRDRIDFVQILIFIQQSKIFNEVKKKQIQGHKHVTEQFQIQEQKPFNIVQQSQAIFIPFHGTKQQQQQYQQLLKQRYLKKQDQIYLGISHKIQQYLISMRLILYFFDRLSRRLHIQYVQIVKNVHTNSQIKTIFERVILSIIILAKKINQQTIKQRDLNKIFTLKQWQLYKNRKPQLLKLIEKDKQYLFLLLQDNLIQKSQCQIIQKRQIVKKSQANIDQYLKQVRKYLIQLLQLKKVDIDPHHRKSLITLVYLISSLKIIDNFGQWVEKYEQIQNYFRTIETQSSDELLIKIINGLGQMDLKFTIFLQEEFQQLKII